MPPYDEQWNRERSEHQRLSCDGLDVANQREFRRGAIQVRQSANDAAGAALRIDRFQVIRRQRLHSTNTLDTETEDATRCFRNEDGTDSGASHTEANGKIDDGEKRAPEIHEPDHPLRRTRQARGGARRHDLTNRREFTRAQPACDPEEEVSAR